MFAFTMVVSLLPASILADENAEPPVVDETVNVETPAEVPEETPAPEPAVEEQKIVIGGPIEVPSEPIEVPEETIEVPGDEIALPGIGGDGSNAIVRPTATPGTGHKITFHGNGGQITNTQKAYTSKNAYEPDEVVSISEALGGKKFTHPLSADYSTNYRFAGWNTKADGSGTAYESTGTLVMPATALDLYAQWEEYEWIHWNVRMGEGGAQIEYAFGTVQSFKAYCGNQGNQAGMVPAAYYSPVKAVPQEGYKFLGWYYGDALITDGSLTIQVFRNLPKLTMETSGAVLEARFEALIKVVYTDGVGGVAFADQVYYVEKDDPTPAFEGTPERNNCTFAGWLPEVAETVTENVTYVAQWEVAEPEDPKYNTPDELFKIACTSDASHPEQAWNWFGSHVVYNKDKAWNEARGLWTATAKVNLSQFLYQYQKATGHKHYCTDASGKNVSSVNIPLIWNPDQGLWLPDGMTTIEIWCYTQPAAPTSAAKLSKGNGIWVRDTDDTKNYTKYTGKKLLEGTYSFGEMTKDEDGNFWCTLTVTDLQPYVDAFDAKYNADGSKAPYIIDADSTTATFSYILKYTGSTTDYKQDGSGWAIDDSSFANNTEKLNGKTLWVYSRYKVTYTDGVEGEEIFADQVYMVPAGEATPAFDGTPTRTNWDFKGWNPEVSDEVTGNVTYVAQWEKSTKNKPAASKNIKKADADKMMIRAYAKGTSAVSTGGEDWSCSPSVRAKGVSYTIGSIQGNDVDGYTTTVTFHFKSGDAFESAARTVFNSDTYKTWHPAWQGNWSYSFDESRPADQTLTLYWVTTVNAVTGKVTGKWCILNAAGTGYAPNITTAVATVIQVNLSLSRTVTYTDGVEDAEIFADQSYTVSNGAATPAFEGTPQREGYRFDGWTPALAEKVYADAVYTAKWVKTYTVTYSDGKGGTLFADEVHVVDEGTATPAFEGSTEYAGWIFKSWKPTVAAKVNADATYVAQWKQGPSNILRLNGNGGSKNGYPISDTYWNSESAILRSDGSEFSYPGYIFKGWNTQADGKGITYKKGDSIPFEVAHNGEVVVLYAQWKQGPSNILRLNGNGGLKNGYPTSDTYWNSDAAILRSTGSEFSYPGHVFAGWNSEQDGSGITYKRGDSIPFQVAHNGEVVVLYAQWEAIPVTVTYTDGVGGAAFKDQVFTVAYGDAVPAFDGTPSRKGYKFLGWDVTEIPEAVTEDITFTAQWKVINDSDVPKTGDSDRILRPAVLMGALLLMGAGVAMTVVTKRRKQED